MTSTPCAASSASQGRSRVVKNTLALRALTETGTPAAVESILRGRLGGVRRRRPGRSGPADP